MNDVMTAHAVERFQERFAGNLSWDGAQERLRRLLRRARFVDFAPTPGQAACRFCAFRGVCDAAHDFPSLLHQTHSKETP